MIKIIEGGLIKIIDGTHTVLPEGEVSVVFSCYYTQLPVTLLGVCHRMHSANCRFLGGREPPHVTSPCLDAEIAIFGHLARRSF